MDAVNEEDTVKVGDLVFVENKPQPLRFFVVTEIRLYRGKYLVWGDNDFGSVDLDTVKKAPMKDVLRLTQINIATREGRYLLAAVAMLFPKLSAAKHYEDVMDRIAAKSMEMCAEEPERYPEITEKEPVPTSFEYELQQLLNSYSMENGSNTPDFILAKYLKDCLGVYDRALQARDEHYNFRPFDRFRTAVKYYHPPAKGCPFSYCTLEVACEGHCMLNKPA